MYKFNTGCIICLLGLILVLNNTSFRSINMGNIYYGVNQDNLDPRNKLIHGYVTGENENWKKGTGININDVVGKYGLDVTTLIDNEKDDLNSFFGFNDLDGLTVAFAKQWALENPTEPLTEEVVNECKNLARNTLQLKQADVVNKSNFSKLFTNIKNNSKDYPEYHENTIYTDLFPKVSETLLGMNIILGEHALDAINRENIEGMKRTNIRLKEEKAKEEAFKNSPDEIAKKKYEEKIKELQLAKDYYSQQGYADGFYKDFPEAKEYINDLK